MNATPVRALLGAATIAAIAGITVAAVGSFRDDFSDTVPLTVMSPRAALVMNPDAKVKLLGVPVGRVGSIEERPEGRAAIHLPQGIPPDRRVDQGATLYAPVEGTPPPPGPDPGAPVAAPSSFEDDRPGSGPAVAFAQYNPRTGAYMAPDGQLYRQSDATTAEAPRSWTDLMPGPK